MAKSYIWLEEYNQLITDFSIRNMTNPNLSINKAFKEQVTKCMKTEFVAMTQQHTGKILNKKNTRVLALFMFYNTIQKKQRNFSNC